MFAENLNRQNLVGSKLENGIIKVEVSAKENINENTIELFARTTLPPDLSIMKNK